MCPLCPIFNQNDRGRATRLFSSKEKRGGGGDHSQTGNGSSATAVAAPSTLGTVTSAATAATERGTTTSTSGAMCASNRTTDFHRLVNQGSHGGGVSDSFSVSISFSKFSCIGYCGRESGTDFPVHSLLPRFHISATTSTTFFILVYFSIL